jgi:outer membrane protein TolC
MHSKSKIIAAVLFAFIVAGKCYAQESMINDINLGYLQQLIDTAKKYYPKAKILQTQTAIARTTYHQQETSWLDIITPSYIYNAGNASLNLVTPNLFNGYQIAFTLNLGTIVAKPFLIHNAKQAVKVAQLQQDDYNVTLEAQVKRYYYAYMFAKANLRVLNKSVQDAQVNLAQIKHKFESGETTLTEYNSALTASYAQSSSKISGELAVFNAKVNLEEFVGRRLEDIK